MYVSAMLMNFLRYVAFLTIFLKYLYNNLSSPEIDELLYFSIELIKFSSEDIFHIIVGLLGISSSKLMLIWQFSIILKDKWRACQKLLSLIYS